MNLQGMIDALGDAMMKTRANYQVTIGPAIEFLSSLPEHLPVRYKDGGKPGRPMSYRGYYSDLAFADGEELCTVERLLWNLREVHGQTLEGYKGGDYQMHSGVPIWRSEYGDASGVAWMAIHDRGNYVEIETLKVD